MDANIRRSGLLGAIFQAGTTLAQLVNCITKIHTNFSLTLEAILLTTFVINNKGKILYSDCADGASEKISEKIVFDLSHEETLVSYVE